MSPSNYTDLSELRKAIAVEEKKYIDALKQDAVFEIVKQIRLNIKSLRAKLGEHEDSMGDAGRSDFFRSNVYPGKYN